MAWLPVSLAHVPSSLMVCTMHIEFTAPWAKTANSKPADAHTTHLQSDAFVDDDGVAHGRELQLGLQLSGQWTGRLAHDVDGRLCLASGTWAIEGVHVELWIERLGRRRVREGEEEGESRQAVRSHEK